VVRLGQGGVAYVAEYASTQIERAVLGPAFLPLPRLAGPRLGAGRAHRGADDSVGRRGGPARGCEESWFLGRIFYYAEPGTYFGVPLSNFAGWFLVGWAIAGDYLWAVGRRPQALGSLLGGIGRYYEVVLFKHGITGWIGERTLLGAGIPVHVAVFLLVYALEAVSVTRVWTAERPAGSGLP
jgi:hypothetical protein